jgi:hypothetical protein
MGLEWAGNGHSLRRLTALRKGWREMRELSGLQPSPKYILQTIIVDHNMYKSESDQKTREHSNMSGVCLGELPHPNPAPSCAYFKEYLGPAVSSIETYTNI